jgi:hypothetical protein
VNLNVLRGAGRRLPSPHNVDQPVDGNDLVPLQEQHRQDEALLAPAKLDRLALAVIDVERPEYPEVHARSGFDANTKPPISTVAGFGSKCNRAQPLCTPAATRQPDARCHRPHSVVAERRKP